MRTSFRVVHFVKCVCVRVFSFLGPCVGVQVCFLHVVCLSRFAPCWCVFALFVCASRVSVYVLLHFWLVFVLFLNGVFALHVCACSSGQSVVSVGLCTIRAICNMPI